MESQGTVCSAETAVLEKEVARLKQELCLANSKALKFKNEAMASEAKAKEQSWYAQELGKFIDDIANCRYEGQEIVAARRVYNLNSGSINRKRLNAHNYDTFDEARQGYLDHMKTKDCDELSMMAWLFKPVDEVKEQD